MHFFYENKGDELMLEYASRLVAEAHLHDHLEVVLMTGGKASAYVDGQGYTFGAGDMFLVFPNQIHQYDDGDGQEYMIGVFAPELYADFRKLLREKIPRSPVVRGLGKDPEITGWFRDMIASRQQDGPYPDIRTKAYLLLILSKVFEQVEFEDVSASDSDVIRDLIQYCMANYKEDISLASAAADLHLNKYYISHLFKDKLRIGFHEYISSLRISEARQLLNEEGMTVTDAAYAAGFNSTRSFNRAFRKYTNMTPSAYRQG